MFSELILLISISFKDCWVKKSMKTVAIYFYVKIFKANKKFYMLRTAYFVFPFPVTDNKKDSQFLGSLELQLVAAHGFEPRTLRVWTACSSQLSYAAIWSWWPGLNWWPYPYQGYALPTELHQQYLVGCGGRTWTTDLRVMSPTSYQLLHPAMKVGGWGWIRTNEAKRGRFTVCSL